MFDVWRRYAGKRSNRRHSRLLLHRLAIKEPWTCNTYNFICKRLCLYLISISSGSVSLWVAGGLLVSHLNERMEKIRLPTKHLLKAVVTLGLVALVATAPPSPYPLPTDYTPVPLTVSQWDWIVGAFLVAAICSCTIENYRQEAQRSLEDPLGSNTKGRPIPFISTAAAGAVATWRAVSSGDHTSACQPTQLDPDIGGVGVQVGVYVPALLACISLLVGQYYSGETSTKELGIAMLASKSFHACHD